MKVYFKPWIGANYESADRKVLVIGDSHYCEQNDCESCGIRGNCSFDDMGDCRNFTINTVRVYLDIRRGVIESEKWAKTYHGFDKLYYGRQSVSAEESMNLWQNIAFYNFMQTAAAPDANNRNYSSAEYALSSPMATFVINELRPDVIIVWGSRAYGALTDEGWASGDNDYSGSYTLSDGHKIKCIKINHPSRANFDIWSQRLADFMN